MGKDPDRVGALQGTEQHRGLRRWNSRKRPGTKPPGGSLGAAGRKRPQLGGPEG